MTAAWAGPHPGSGPVQPATGLPPGVRREVEALLAEPRGATAALVATDLGGEPACSALGVNLGRAVAVNWVAELNCMAKPIVGWRLLELADEHGVDVEAPLGEVLPDLARLDVSVSISAILNQRTGLAQPSALEWMATPDERRPTVETLRREPAGEWYSEVGAGMVATAAIEALDRRPALDSIKDMLTRCAVDLWLGGSHPPEAPILTPVATDRGRWWPLWHVEHPTYLSRVGPAMGGLGSPHQVTRLLSMMGAALRGEPGPLVVAAETVARVRAGRRAPGADRTWHRAAGFDAGFVLPVDGVDPIGMEGWLLLLSGISCGFGALHVESGSAIAAFFDVGSFDSASHRRSRERVLAAFCAEVSSR